MKSVAGGIVEDIRSQFHEDSISVEPLTKIFVCVGTDDCKESDFDVADVTPTYEAILAEMQKKVPQSSDVNVASIPPRNYKSEHQHRVETLNSALKDMSQRTGIGPMRWDIS